MRIAGIDVVIDGMTNERSSAFILGSFVLEPCLHLPLGELESERKDLTIGWKEVVLLLESPLEHLDLLWSEPHSTAFWSTTGAIGLMLTTPPLRWAAS